MLTSCKKIAIDKAHYHYKNDPKGYSTFNGAEMIDNVYPCYDNSRPNLYNPNLINDTAQFNWAFWGNIHYSIGSDVPTVDLNTKSLVVISVAAHGDNSNIKKYKILINYTDKIILFKFLVKVTSGDSHYDMHIGYIIPKIANDYVVKVESLHTSY